MHFLAKLIVIMAVAALAAVCLPHALGVIGGVVFVAAGIVLASYILIQLISGLFSILASVIGFVLVGIGIVALAVCAVLFLPVLLPLVLILGCVGLVISLICGMMGAVF